MNKESIKVLLVEDDREYAQMMQQLLDFISAPEFRVIWADSLAEGLRQAAAGDIDVILLDLRLPDSEGLDGLAALQAVAPTAPIIVQTAVFDERIALEAMRRGAQDYLFKGQISGDLLVRAMRYAIERKRAEWELNEYRAHLEELVEARTAEVRAANEQYHKLSRAIEHSPSIVVITDTAGIIEYVNPKFTKTTGYSSAEACGQSPRVLRSGVHPDEYYKELWLTITRGEEWRGEFCNRRKDGEFYWEAASISAVRNAEGQITHYIKVAEDITERRDADEALARQTEELTRSNAELQRFAYVAAHHLQEPLRLIVLYTQLLAKRYGRELDAEADEFIAYIVDNAMHMKALISDLLAYSQIDRARGNFMPTDCNAVLEYVLTALRLESTAPDAVVTYDDLPIVAADETELQELFYNLIQNGLKFHGTEAPRVHVSVTRQGDVWLFEVRDNGIGIEAEYHEDIFAIFHRLHNRKQYTGTGIGLAICRKIVERHGGRIWVESELGSGATFYFTLRGMD